VTTLLHQLVHVPGPLVLAVVGALVFGEAAVFLGFVFPGETAVLLGGFVASTGRVSVVLLAVVVVLCAVVGDSVGYEVGKRFGPRMLRWRMFERHQTRVERAREFLDGRGGSAIFIGRGTAFLRAVTPGLAGLSGMRYRKFLAWNVLGGVVWGIGCVVAGYLAGSSYEKVAHYLGQAGAAAAALLVVAVLVVWRVRRRAHPDGADEGRSRETAPHDSVGR
jgi:membrane protein DedA with SNARE-associated domain